jgi:hemerythrin-like domain-containing protein
MASDGAPWADTPFALIPTPGRGEDIKKIPDAVWIAREMCCAHNGMLRSLNSIYQQSAHVTKPQDVKDLLLYAKFWCGWIEEHHEGEETFFFPQIETATGVKGLMATNVAQHHSFTSGLEQMEKYVKETAVGDYDGLKLRGIIEGFGHKLTKHLSDEIQTLLGLDKFDGKKMREIYNVFDLEMRKGDKVCILFPVDISSAANIR